MADINSLPEPSIQQLLTMLNENIRINTNTLAINTTQIIDLRNELNNFLSETVDVRISREKKELTQLEADMEAMTKKIEAARDMKDNPMRQRTSEKIRAEMAKGKINWLQVRQIAVQAVFAALSVALVGIVFWESIKWLAAHAP